ncbi:MAG: bifunctional adenosylcobinamide kinase/adenosylcobinamide-phosphate guanylyltransferase [Lachnospiraceae bacterium]|nr:bifunctional adenosylcobinamide kinase/adenosylcobinamide-phosphate guanylyltransferase [Lachnospiraceae bacterium]
MITLVCGGSGSGKSEYAESLVLKLGGSKRFYIATMQPFDNEAYAKIERHRKMRSTKGFETIEAQTDLPSVTFPGGEKGDVLLECISNLVANEMYSPEGAGEKTIERVLAGIESLKNTCNNLIIVSNNVFSDGDDYTPETLKYIDNMAVINNHIAKMADSVVEVVSGIPIIIKGE